MIFSLSGFRKPLAWICLILTATLVRATEPDGDAILAAARVNPLGEKVALKAQLRSDANITPFDILVDGSVRFVFQNPPQEIKLTLGEKAPVLTESRGGENAKVGPARFDEKVRGSALSYEDLSLQFLYWKNAKVLGSDNIRTRDAWKIEVQAPRGASQYGVARLWIDKESGALLRVEGYDMQGRLIRKFEVISAQKIDGQWMLKQMRIEVVDPVAKKTVARTYLEVLGKK